MNFNTEEFLANFFRKDDKVEVNADELQRLIRKSRKMDAEIKRLNTVNDFLTLKVKYQEEKISALKLDSRCSYTLDLTA